MLFYWLKNTQQLPVKRPEDVSGMLMVVLAAAGDLTTRRWFENMNKTDSTNRYVKWWVFVLRVAQQMVLETGVTVLGPSFLDASEEAPAGLTNLWYARRLARVVYRRVSRLPAIQRLAGKFLYGDFSVLCKDLLDYTVQNPLVLTENRTSLSHSDLSNNIGTKRQSQNEKSNRTDMAGQESVAKDQHA